jgi:hypothetical protein
MQAALVWLRIDPAQASAAAATFSTKILPRVRAAAGFVQGYWVDPVDGEGFGFVVFETAEQARDALPPLADWSAPGVTILDVKIRRVAARVP